LLQGLILKTRDPDEAASLLGDSAIPYTYELLPGSPSFKTEIFVAHGQSVCLSRAATSGKMRVRSRLPADCYALVVDLGCGAGLHRMQKHSVAVDSERTFVQSPLQQVEVLTTDEFDILFLRVERQAVVGEVEKMLDRDIRTPLVFAPGFPMYTIAGMRLRELCGSLRRALYSADHRSVGSSLPIRSAENDLLKLLLEAHPHNYTRLVNRSSKGGAWHVRAAEEYIRANAHLPLSLGDICRAAGVNVRTLQHAFQKKRGRCPMQFLREVRLQEVRAALSQPSEDTSVTGVAAHWGFLHFGRFAREYRCRFGELPSETLRRAQRKAHLRG